jgi:Tfp pilus assembly protein FimT
VLALIGVVLGMAAPSLRGFVASRQATDTAAQILALTQLARSRASAEGRVYRLNIESETGTYWLTAQCRGTFTDLNTGLGRHFDCPDGVTISLHSATDQDEPEHIEFHPTGRTDQATIKVNDRRGEAFHVVCQSATEPFHVIKASQALKDETQ